MKLADARRKYADPKDRVRNWQKKNREHCNELRRKYYKNNPEVYRAMDKRKRNKRLAKLWELKDVPCADCGGKFHPVCMQFDHIGEGKNGCVSRMNSYKSMIEEAEKCEVVCANCHAIRTWERKQ